MKNQFRINQLEKDIKLNKVTTNYKDFINGLKIFYKLDINTIIYLKAIWSNNLKKEV